MAQLRWILAGLGVVAIAIIWWWSTRRSGQAPGNSELRETTVLPVQSLAPATEARERSPGDRQDARERTISPLEPLSIRTADFERVPILDLPMMASRERGHDPVEDADTLESSMLGLSSDPHPIEVEIDVSADAAPAVAAAPSQAPLDLGVAAENSDRVAAVEPTAPDRSEQQKIVTLRVCAVGEDRWSGRDLMAALEGHGLAYGRYQVYHRRHADGRSIFCVASLIEPGTFDAARMPEEEFRGVSMFAVLPGPTEPLQAIDALLMTARDLARDLSGTIQDSKGMPFSPQRIATLREDVARFQSALNSSARHPPARGPAA